MGIQNNINAMLGTAAAAATMSKHISEQSKAVEEQKKTNEVKAAETEVEAAEVSEEMKQIRGKLTNQSVKLINDVIQGDPASTLAWDQATKEGATGENFTDKALEEKSNYERHKFLRARDDFKNYEGNDKEMIEILNKNIEMGEKAYKSSLDVIEARRKYKFDYDQKKKELDILNRKIEILKGGKR